MSSTEAEDEPREAESVLYSELVTFIAEAAVHYGSDDTILPQGVFYQGHTSAFEHTCDVLLELNLLDPVEIDGRPFEGRLPDACCFRLRMPSPEIAAFVNGLDRPRRPSLNKLVAVFIMSAEQIYRLPPSHVMEPFATDLDPALLGLLIEAGFLTRAGSQFAWTEKAQLPLRGPYPDTYQA